MTNQEFVVLAKKNPVSFGCAALSLALVAGLYFRSEAMPEAEAELTQKSASGERMALNIQYSAQLKEQADAMAAATKEIDSRIIRTSQVTTNTQYFYKLEADTGVKISDLRQTTPAVVAKPPKGTFVPVAFSVTVQGTLSQLLEFLRQVENGAHYSRVLTATWNGNAANRNSPLTLGLSIELLGLP
jgi:hypothetical protein